MGIFDFFRKFKKTDKIEELENEKIPFSEIENWIENNVKKIEEKEEEIFSMIKEKIARLSKEISEKTKAVESFDMDSKKVEDKIKSITEDGRKKYIESLDYLLNNLENLKRDRFEKTISEIDKLFSDFSKKSRSSYEKATILIGKEMKDLKETLKSFSSDIIEIFEKNKILSELSKSLSLIKSKLREFEKKGEEIKKCEKEIDFLDSGIKNKEKDEFESLEEAEKIKKSKEYSDIQEKKEKAKMLEKELEKDISELRQSIDFKALGNFYHIFEDKIKLLKSHINNFIYNFNRDNGEAILELILDAKLPEKNIPEKISKIRNKKEETRKLEEEIKKEKILEKLNELEYKSARAIAEKEDMKSKKTREEKKLKVLTAEKDEIFRKIEENTEKINIDFISFFKNSEKTSG